MQTWTFGPSGLYTATWDGVSKVTVTLTAGGAFVASFFAQSLTAAVASPEYQAILSPTPSAVSGLQLVATTGVAGFALQNATPTILSWTAPNDGGMHPVEILGTVHVTVSETGGQVAVAWTAPDGTAFLSNFFTASQGANVYAGLFSALIKGGTTVSVTQNSALTVGAALTWFEILGA